VETGTLVHIAAALGISSLIASSAVAFSVVKYAGAAYLVYLGIRTLLQPPATPGTEGPKAPQQLARVYREGIVVNVLNPKVALFFLAFLPQFVDPAAGSAAAQIVVLGLVMMVLGLLSDIGYALTGGALGRLLTRRPRFLRVQRYVSGGVYLGLGATAALSGDARR